MRGPGPLRLSLSSSSRFSCLSLAHLFSSLRGGSLFFRPAPCLFFKCSLPSFFFGFPLRLRTAVKLGFKNPKWIRAIEVTNTYQEGFWEKQGFNWFAGL